MKGKRRLAKARRVFQETFNKRFDLLKEATAPNDESLQKIGIKLFGKPK